MRINPQFLKTPQKAPWVEFIIQYLGGKNLLSSKRQYYKICPNVQMPSTHVHTSACYQVATIGKLGLISFHIDTASKGFQDQ